MKSYFYELGAAFSGKYVLILVKNVKNSLFFISIWRFHVYWCQVCFELALKVNLEISNWGSLKMLWTIMIIFLFSSLNLFSLDEWDWNLRGLMSWQAVWIGLVYFFKKFSQNMRFLRQELFWDNGSRRCWSWFCSI